MRRHFGKLSILVNNAGVLGSAEQYLYSTAAWQHIMGINATGVFLGLKYGVKAIADCGGGSISRA